MARSSAMTTCEGKHQRLSGLQADRLELLFSSVSSLRRTVQSLCEGETSGIVPVGESSFTLLSTARRASCLAPVSSEIAEMSAADRRLPSSPSSPATDRTS